MSISQTQRNRKPWQQSHWIILYCIMLLPVLTAQLNMLSGQSGKPTWALCHLRSFALKHCLWNSSNMRLIEDDLFSSFQARSSSTSSFQMNLSPQGIQCCDTLGFVPACSASSSLTLKIFSGLRFAPPFPWHTEDRTYAGVFKGTDTWIKVGKNEHPQKHACTQARKKAPSAHHCVRTTEMTHHNTAQVLPFQSVVHFSKGMHHLVKVASRLLPTSKRHRRFSSIHATHLATVASGSRLAFHRQILFNGIFYWFSTPIIHLILSAESWVMEVSHCPNGKNQKVPPMLNNSCLEVELPSTVCLQHTWSFCFQIFTEVLFPLNKELPLPPTPSSSLILYLKAVNIPSYCLCQMNQKSYLKINGVTFSWSHSLCSTVYIMSPFLSVNSTGKEVIQHICKHTHTHTRVQAHARTQTPHTQTHTHTSASAHIHTHTQYMHTHTHTNTQ